MNSRLLRRLETAITQAPHPVEAACRRAERAGLLARQGRFDEARAALEALQAEFALCPNAAVSAWVSLGEGLIEYFSCLGDGARDRLRRAHALAGATRLVPLQALCEAWLAHLAYAHHDFDAMAGHLARALQQAAPSQHAARARACLVAAQAYHFAERLDRAQPWYACAHEHAAADGDKQTTGALMHNKAWLHGSHARRADVFGQDRCESARQALLSVESIENYDRLVGAAVLGALVPMLRAQMLTVQGRHGEALVLYRRHLTDAREQGLGRMMGGFHADMAWCRWHVGDTLQARDEALQAARCLSAQDDADDRAMAHARLSQVYRALGDELAAARHARAARADWAAHVAVQARVTEVLDDALEDIMPERAMHQASA